MSVYCQKCQTATATVHVTELKEGKKVELHLCEECAESQGIPPKATPNGMNMFEFVKQFMEQSGATKRTKDRKCSKCGMTFNEFKAKGRFGCSHDYDEFLVRLLPLLRRIHGASEHVHYTGDVEVADERAELPTHEEESADLSSESVNNEPTPQEELQHLRESLERVVANEEYEEAAKLRDRIRELEQGLELEGGSS